MAGEFIAFVVLAAMTLVAGLAAVTSRNIVRAATSLVPAFLGVTGLFVLLRAELLAGVQILIYAGAITVLILFVIMLTEGGTGLGTRQVNEQRVPAILTGGALAAILVTFLVRAPWPAVSGEPSYNAAAVGAALLTTYVLPFEVTSVLILASLIGAIIIARREE